MGWRRGPRRASSCPARPGDWAAQPVLVPAPGLRRWPSRVRRWRCWWSSSSPMRDVNETLGQDSGDALLGQAADRIRGHRRGHAAVQAGWTRLRAGRPRSPARSAAIGTAERIERLMDEPFEVNGLQLAVTARIGIADSAGWRATPMCCCARRAGRSMGAGRRTSSEPGPDRDAQSPERLALAGELRRAIDERELRPGSSPRRTSRPARSWAPRRSPAGSTRPAAWSGPTSSSRSPSSPTSSAP